MKKSLLILALSLASAYALEAAAVVNLYAGQLRNAGGTPMANGGLLQVIARTNGTTAFTAPTATSFVGGSGDDLVAFSYAMNSVTTGFSGQSLQPVTLSLGGSFDTGDPLLLRWWPTLTISSPEPGLGTPYGEYRNGSVVDFSDIAWIAPSDPSSFTLNFLTIAAGGSQPDSAGNASLAVAPEPTTTALMIVGLVSLAARRRRQGI
jgi:hypothetical protein